MKLFILLLFCFVANIQAGLPFRFDPMGTLGLSVWSPADLAPIGWWRGEGDTLDSSGNGINGAWYGTPSYTNGICGQAFSFIGNNSITNGFDSRLATTNMTICFWAYCSLSNTANKVAVSMRENMPSPKGYYIATITEIWKFSFAIGGFSSVGTKFADYYSWNHIAITYQDKTAIMYYNGLSNAALVVAADYIPSTLSRFHIGSLTDGGPRLFFTGLIDETLVYDKALTPSEVLLIYNWRP